MDAIVAVYDDWGIGRDGTQPVTLSADRKFFRRATAGATVIVGRRTLQEIPGASVCPSSEEAAAKAAGRERVFVIGGASVYRQLLPYCRGAYVTKIHALPGSDVFFPDLDADPAWEKRELLEAGEENGIRYEIWRYARKGSA